MYSPIDASQLSIPMNMAMSGGQKTHAYWLFRYANSVITSSDGRFASGFTTINKAVCDAICNFVLTPRGAQPIISGRRLILKAIYPVANFIAACANREEAIIRGSFINAKDPFGAPRLRCDLHLYPRFDSIKNTSGLFKRIVVVIISHLAALALLSLQQLSSRETFARRSLRALFFILIP